MATLIRNGLVVTAQARRHADVLIDGGRVRAIAAGIKVGADVQVHDATGLLVLPGAVDVHTHLEMVTPRVATIDTFASGTRAAASPAAAL